MRRSLILLTIILACVHLPQALRCAPLSSDARIAAAYGKLPLAFVQNQGQMDAQIRYSIRGPKASAYFTNAGMILDLAASSPAGREHSRLAMNFAGAGADCKAEGVDALPGKVNYFVGRDSSKWRTDIPTYGGIIYRDVWPGVDVSYRGDRHQLKYDIRVSAGADVRDIRLRYDGARKLWLDKAGDLHIDTPAGAFEERVPGIYQERSGEKVQVAGGYVMLDSKTVGFAVRGRDETLPLVIDPASNLVYSTYLGGSSGDVVNAIAVDAYGCAYVTGLTYSANFPLQNAYQSTNAGGTNGVAFVTKLNAAGTAQQYSTYLGGSGGDEAYAIAVDTAGCAYVAGQTASTDFPVKGAYQSSLAGFDNLFVTKLNASGNALDYSTYVGGSNDDSANAIVVDSYGCAYVAGWSESDDFPVTQGAYQSSLAGQANAVIVKMNATGSDRTYCTYLGGNYIDWVSSETLDSSNNLYLAGITQSSNFPASKGAVQGTLAGEQNAFVTKLNTTGTALIYSTYLGGGSNDWAWGIAVDSSGCAYVAGETSSSDFPTTLGAYQTAMDGTENGFVTKLNSTATAPLIYSTFIGGSDYDLANGVVVDSSGCAYIVGQATSTDFPTTTGAFQTTFGGGTEYGTPSSRS